jgi:hypothetical protein
MAPRVIPVALLVVAVALAGCGATFGSPGMDTTPADTETRSTTATPTVTETPTVSATPTTAPTSDGISLPPGVTGEGVDDPLALTNAHATVLSDSSFAVAMNTTERYENGTLRSREVITATFGESGDRYAVDYAVSGSLPSLMDASTGRLSAWADGEQVYQRLVVNGSASYQRLHDANGDARDPQDYLLADQIEEDRLYVLLSTFDGSVERVSRNGTTYYRLASENFSNSESVAATVDLDSIERANLTAVVDARGIVHEYRLEYAGSIDDRSVHGVHEVAYDDVGSATVERPDWVDEAENATSG